MSYVSVRYERVQYIARVAYRERWSRARGYAYGLVHACLTCDALHNSYLILRGGELWSADPDKIRIRPVRRADGQHQHKNELVPRTKARTRRRS